jgi:RNA polymerase-binding transcription factor DksA
LSSSVSDLLATKAAEVDAEIAALTVPLESGGAIQFGKRAGDSTAVAAELLARVSAHEQLLALAADIARAREKVADGSYGVCDVCGSAVGEERLEALPWAVRCVTCASSKRR